jgi:hypothetical protein
MPYQENAKKTIVLAEKNAAYSIDSTSMPFYQHVMLRYPDQASFVMYLEPYHDAAVWCNPILNVHGNAKKMEESKIAKRGRSFTVTEGNGKGAAATTHSGQSHVEVCGFMQARVDPFGHGISPR